MKLNLYKPLLWLILFGILASLFGVMPALADGAGWPTATPSPTLIRLVTATSPFGGAVTPVIIITPLGKDQGLPAMDQAAQPTIISGSAQQTAPKTSSSLIIVGVLGLLITAVLLFILLTSFLRRND